MNAEEFAAKWFPLSSNQLVIGSIPVAAIAERFGTPLFIYDAAVLAHKLAQLRGVLGPVSLFYSLKANPNPAFLRFFVSNDCGLEVSSLGELRLALQAGCPPADIAFAGPAKTEDEIGFAIASRVGLLHLESIAQISRAGRIAAAVGVVAAIGLRINLRSTAAGAPMALGGGSSPFGIDEETLEEALDEASKWPALSIIGVHASSFTQVLDHEVLARHFRAQVAAAAAVARKLSVPLKTIGLGGGLGVPYFGKDREVDLTAFGAALTQLVDIVKHEPLLSSARLVFEPGRYLVAEAGVYVAKVVDIKRSRGITYVIVDGGMHQHLAASGNLGQGLKRNFPCALLNKLGEQPADTVNVVGPLCTPLDVLARDVSLPRAEPGDLIGVFQSGAYARTASPMGFLSHPTPPEVLVKDGETWLIRRRGRFEDAVDLHDPPLRCAVGTNRA
jgi:diaminopimelate decarboxylase